MKQKIIIGLVFLLAGILVGVIIYKNLLVTPENLPTQQTPQTSPQISDEYKPPLGYSNTDYTIEKVLAVECQIDIDCITPGEYMIQSRCPFTSKCLENKCTVVCPDFVGNK